MTVSKRPTVLMVTDAYFPELSGAGLRCRALIGRLRGRVDFAVLTGASDRSLRVNDVQDGIPVDRVFIDPRSRRVTTSVHVFLTSRLLRRSGHFSIAHFHDWRMSAPLLGVAQLLGKRVAITLTSAERDDPLAIKQHGGVRYRLYRKADRVFAVSPRFEDSYEAAGLPRDRFRLMPNAVDADRFHPAAPGEREALRRELRLPADSRIVLFVGFFAREKQPELLFEAWAKSAIAAHDSALVLVGAARSSYHHLDVKVADRIRQKAHALGLEPRLRFVEATYDIERFHRAADVFVVPSVRDSIPNVLLEAMASGTPCIAARVDGVTDAIIQHERNGLLVPPGDLAALHTALRWCYEHRDRAEALGAAARRTIKARFDLGVAADAYYNSYCDLAGGPPRSSS